LLKEFIQSSKELGEELEHDLERAENFHNDLKPKAEREREDREVRAG
jgi:hypothetical protein